MEWAIRSLGLKGRGCRAVVKMVMVYGQVGTEGLRCWKQLVVGGRLPSLFICLFILVRNCAIL